MLNHQNTVVLVVDIQERLLPVLHQSAEFAAACRRWIQGSQYLSLPIILTEQYPKGLGKTVADVAVLLNDAPVFEKRAFPPSPKKCRLLWRNTNRKTSS